MFLQFHARISPPSTTARGGAARSTCASWNPSRAMSPGGKENEPLKNKRGRPIKRKKRARAEVPAVCTPHVQIVHIYPSMIVCVPYLVLTFVPRHLGPRPLERILPTLQGSMPSLSAVPTMGRRGREEVWRYPRAGPHAGSVALMPFSRATRQAKPALNARGGTNTGMRSMLDRTGTTKAKARNGNALQDGKGRVICNNKRQPRR